MRHVKRLKYASDSSPMTVAGFKREGVPPAVVVIAGSFRLLLMGWPSAPCSGRSGFRTIVKSSRLVRLRHVAAHVYASLSYDHRL